MANNIVKTVIDGTEYTVRPYATCSTAAATAAKTVSYSGFSLTAGATIIVRFAHAISTTDTTLNVNSTGAKTIFYMGAKLTPGVIKDNTYCELLYDGMYWHIINLPPSGGTSEIESLRNQVLDLKATLNAIITGKTWDATIWPQ
jgi:hypothetical protein